LLTQADILNNNLGLKKESTIKAHRLLTIPAKYKN